MNDLKPLALFQPHEMPRMTAKWQERKGATNGELGALLGHIEALAAELAAEKEHTAKYAAQFKNEPLEACVQALKEALINQSGYSPSCNCEDCAALHPLLKPTQSIEPNISSGAVEVNDTDLLGDPLDTRRLVGTGRNGGADGVIVYAELDAIRARDLDEAAYDVANGTSPTDPELDRRTLLRLLDEAQNAAVTRSLKLGTAETRIKELETALAGILRYGLDTLSGRTDGPDDRAWQRAGVNEMTRRARVALAAEKPT